MQNTPNTQDFNLIISEAKNSHLEKDTEVQEEINKVLYKHYIQKILKQHPIAELSNDSLKQMYEAKPLVRFLELVVPHQDSKIVNKVKKDISKKKDFVQLVMKYSISPNSQLGGDTDYRNPEQLPAKIYQSALSLKKGEVSDEIILNDYSYFIKLVDIKKFEEVPVTYLDFLKYQYLQEQENKIIANYIQKLKKTNP